MDEFHDSEILAEIRANREARAKRFNYDGKAMIEDLMQSQATSGLEYTPPPPKSDPAAQSRSATDVATGLAKIEVPSSDQD